MTRSINKKCTIAKTLIDMLRDAVKEFERVEVGGAANPNWPDPLGSAAYNLDNARRCLDEIERELAMLTSDRPVRLPGQPAPA